MPITVNPQNSRVNTQHYLVKFPKSAGARHSCPKIPRVPGTLGTCANSSPADGPSLVRFLLVWISNTTFFFKKVKNVLFFKN